MYTLENETDKDAIQDEQKYPLDTIMLKATSYDKFLIVFSLIFFVLFLTFPILTNYIIPSVCYNLYNWLIGYKVIYWISIVLGGIFTIYIIRFTFLIGRLARVIKRI